MTQFGDLYNINENERIDLIGRTVMAGPKTSGDKPRMVAFVVDNHKKADRYIRKLEKKFPGIRIIDRFDGPVHNTVTVRVGEPLR